MQIVEAGIDYIFAIRSIAQRVWPQTFSPILSQDQIVYMMEMMYSESSLTSQMTEQGHHFLLAKDEDEYLGYISYQSNYKSKDETKIHKIYILPSIQGKGTGRFLITAIENIAKQQNNNSLTLNVNRYNEALNFYTKMGFEISGKENINIGNGFLMEDYILKKKL